MSVIQDIIKNEGDPDSWPVDVHEYTRQQTLFWESYLLIFKYSFTEQLSVSRVWSSRGHCITTARLGQVLVPDQHRSYLQSQDAEIETLKTFQKRTKVPFSTLL